MSFFVFANFFNYLDRGIIPGAASEFDGFIEGSVEFDDDMSNVDTYLGLLQSAFVVGMSISMPIFANLVHTRPPFRLVGIGLAVWCVSAVLAGLSKQTNSFSVLVLARMLSGVGEASFQVVAAPYIQDNGGEAQGMWLGFYYTAIPFGTCVGYGFGAAIATTDWSLAFYLEALMMAPLMLICFILPKNIHKQRIPDSEVDNILRVSFDENDTNTESEMNDEDMFEVGGDAGLTILDEVLICVKRPLFVWSMLGYAAYSGGIIGFSTYGPQFVMGLGYFDEEFKASIIFGASMALAGLVGTPLGGFALDWTLARRQRQYPRGASLTIEGDGDLTEALAESKKDNDDISGYVNSSVLSAKLNFVGILIGLICIFDKDTMIWFGAFSLAGLFLFASTAAMNVSVLESVPHENRSFAIAFSTLLMHMLGDVPSPIVVGTLKDLWAPHCTPEHIADDDKNDDIEIPDECDHEQTALRSVIAFIFCWLLLSPICYFIGYLFASFKLLTWGSITQEKHNPAKLRSDFINKDALYS
jgi:MFS family permease